MEVRHRPPGARSDACCSTERGQEKAKMRDHRQSSRHVCVCQTGRRLPTHASRSGGKLLGKGSCPSCPARQPPRPGERLQATLAPSSVQLPRETRSPPDHTMNPYCPRAVILTRAAIMGVICGKPLRRKLGSPWFSRVYVEEAPSSFLKAVVEVAKPRSSRHQEGTLYRTEKPVTATTFRGSEGPLFRVQCILSRNWQRAPDRQG